MTELKPLLELRNKIKNRKPEFIRQDYHRRIRINRKWRRPKGLHSKIRHHFKGRRKMPSPGYKSPVKVKGLHKSGLKFVIVSSSKELLKVNKNSEGIVIAKGTGMKKRLEILRNSKELGITVFNFSIDESIKKIEEKIALRKKKDVKEIKKEAPKKKEPAQEKVGKEPEKIEDKSVKKTEAEKPESALDEDRKSADKREKDKILTKKV
jgi:large subunit ribosomal protein L32e